MTATVTFVPVNPPGPSVVALLGDGPFTAPSTGGWSFQARPRRVGFTEWAGEDPYTLTGPILFDGFAKDRSVEGPVEALNKMLRNPVGPRKEPPVIQVRSVAVPQTQRYWVLQSLTPGDLIRNRHGVLVRAAYTVTLLEYVAGDVIVSVRQTAAQAAQARARSSSRAGKGKSYTVKRGDTLGSIAARQLGNSKRGAEIGTLNHIRDPKALRVGQVLRLP